MEFRNKKPKQEELNEELYSRIEKLKRCMLNDSSIPSDKLNSFYCSLCGAICFVTNILLDNLPRRRTDDAISIDLRINFLKLNLERDRLKYIKRGNGVELQYRWRCECGISVGYTSISYEEFEHLRKDEKAKVSNKPYFYLYNGAVVEKMKESKLVSELVTHKETLLLHLKKKGGPKGGAGNARAGNPRR